MKEFSGRIAVVTGAASGIGLAFAMRFAKEGMKVVLADIEDAPLAAARAAIEAQGGKAVAVRTNVMREEEVKRLADAAFDAFGNVHVLCNNAGVSGGAGADGVWNVPREDWDWVLGVNFSGVLHGIRYFVPRMLAKGEPGHIVNTASVAGLISPAGMGIYCVSKHAVVTLTECLHHDLASKTDKVKASVLCPAYVPTGISDSERNRPAELRNAPKHRDADEIAREEQLRKAVSSGRVSAEMVGDIVFEAIRDERFYILTHPKIKGAIETRMQDILLERSPTDTSKPPAKVG